MGPRERDLEQAQWRLEEGRWKSTFRPPVLPNGPRPLVSVHGPLVGSLSLTEQSPKREIARNQVCGLS